jgi:hypothetical protein
MESQLRALLYNQLKNRTVAFNPVEPEPFDLVDLTRDVTNATRIYHTRTECVREALAGANLIITDSQPLANAVQRVLPRATVAALPFGYLKEWGTPAEPSKGPVVGLLNHDGAMETGTALLCHNAPGYYDLTATGVQLLPNEAKAWRNTLDILAAQPIKLKTMQERNRAYATRLNRESYSRLAALQAQHAAPPRLLASTGHSVSEGCGCAKKGKSAPTRPDQDQPIIEKES